VDFVEPHLRLVPSVKHRGYRVRAVCRQVFFRPPNETFHEFLHVVVKLTFGKEWWTSQLSLPEAKKHVVVKWSEAVLEWLKANKTEDNQVNDGLWSFPLSGHAQALLQLGFDLFSLQQVDRLPEDLIGRLRDHKEFQGARYEVGVAAMFARAGFTAQFCQPAEGEKICEFVARHPSGLVVAVEAKSRRRPGVLNEKGEQPEEFRADFKKLYANARKKKPSLPFVIFIDANLPPAPEILWEDSPWLPQIKAVFDSFPLPTPEQPDPHNWVVITNQGYYYCGDGPSKMQPALYLISEHPKYPTTHPAAWQALYQSVERYSAIPQEV